MTTRLNKVIARKTDVRIRDRSKYRAIVVSLHPAADDKSYIGLRLEKCRQVETVPIDAVYSLAVKMRVARERAEKKAAKKNRWQ